jgi:hypothetical protein
VLIVCSLGLQSFLFFDRLHTTMSHADSGRLPIKFGFDKTVQLTLHKIGVMMSVRATERLIGDVVIASGLANSPKMVVLGVDIEAKRVITVWFSDSHEGQEGEFPASALDRFEASAAPAKKAPAKKTGKKK